MTGNKSIFYSCWLAGGHVRVPSVRLLRSERHGVIVVLFLRVCRARVLLRSGPVLRQHRHHGRLPHELLDALVLALLHSLRHNGEVRLRLFNLFI